MKIAFVLGMLALPACSTTVRRITDEEAAKVSIGMTIEEVRSILGRPWQEVKTLNPEVQRHRYVMERVEVERIEFDRMRVRSVTQYRVLDLDYLHGKLVAPR